MAPGKLLTLLASATLMACVVEMDEDDRGGTGPGDDPWQDDDPSCETEADCAPGEGCENGLCLVKRCGESYASVAPMGDNHYFGTDAEMVVLSDAAFIDAFESQGGDYINSWDLGAETIVDVAGGNFDGNRPMGVAVALQYSDVIHVRLASGVKELAVGIWPVAIASGDVDNDEKEELVVFAADGRIELCDVDTEACQSAEIAGAAGKDVEIADVDGDGYAEALFLFDMNGESELVVWNLDAAATGQDESYGWVFNFPIRSIGAGDLDGDTVAEVVALEDGGWWGWADDKLHLFSPKDESLLGNVGINGHTRDVAVGDRDSDDVAEVVVLREDHKLELLGAAGGSLSSIMVADVTVGTEATRVSMLDWDGDSASGRLVSGPELVTGEMIPTTVLTFPPYPRDIAAGTSSVDVGNAESTSETRSDTISLKLGVMVGYGLETPIFEAKVSAQLEKSWSVTQSVSQSLSIGQYFYIEADPSLHGADYGAVIMSCGCYHRYRYETEDPRSTIGGSGQIVEIFIPVGGQTVLWSSKRYNAMAAALGTLPQIAIPYRVGDPSSYPDAPLNLEGQLIQEADMVFPNLPSFQVSDVGTTSFRIYAGETTTNELSEETSVGVSGSFGAGGFEVELSAGVGYATGYAISVGNEALFAGDVPPIPNDVDTPEDEFAIHRYSFTPLIYRQRYLDFAGEETGYYVVAFARGQ
jgi:hypothetical protein